MINPKNTCRMDVRASLFRRHWAIAQPFFIRIPSMTKKARQAGGGGGKTVTEDQCANGFRLRLIAATI